MSPVTPVREIPLWPNGAPGSEGKARGEGVSAWRAHSLNFDREHAGDKGEPWRRMFMSDLATGFAVLALVGSD